MCTWLSFVFALGILGMPGTVQAATAPPVAHAAASKVPVWCGTNWDPDPANLYGRGQYGGSITESDGSQIAVYEGYIGNYWYFYASLSPAPGSGDTAALAWDSTYTSGVRQDNIYYNSLYEIYEVDVLYYHNQVVSMDRIATRAVRSA
jgi:hypothetical protein